MTLTAALTEAKTAMATATPGRAMGCCRVYVCLSGLDKKTRAEAEAFAKSNHLIFQKKAHYGLKDALYIGYDNCRGLLPAQGDAFVASLKVSGFGAYVELCGD